MSVFQHYTIPVSVYYTLLDLYVTFQPWIYRVLLFVSTFEKETCLLWDSGVDLALSVDDLDKLQFKFRELFDVAQPEEALLAKIRASIPLFQEYLPVGFDDVNELPNHLEVEL